MSSGWQRLVLRSCLGLVGLLVWAGTPTTASAGVLQYCPSGSCSASGDANDIEDLDHHNFYTWKVGGVNLGGQDISKVTLTFKQLYNWDSTANKLFLQLLDTAKNSGGTLLTSNGYSTVRSYQDETLDHGPMSDVFNNNWTVECAGLSGSALTTCKSKQTTEQTQENNLVASGTGEAALTSRAFADLGTYPTAAPGGPNPAGWSFVADGSLGGEPLYTYTYTFSEGQEDLLQSFITSGGDFAIGLDPDFHFYNDGVMLTITTGSPVPEPAALLLLAPGALFAWRRRKVMSSSRL